MNKITISTVNVEVFTTRFLFPTSQIPIRDCSFKGFLENWHQSSCSIKKEQEPAHIFRKYYFYYFQINAKPASMYITELIALPNTIKPVILMSSIL